MSLPLDWIKFAPKPRELAGGEEWNVFLSYRSVNRPWVLNLYDVLRQQGHRVFLDQCVLKAGDPLIGKLEKALAASQAGVLVWSSASGDSDWVRREYGALEAFASSKPGFQFVPVRLDSSSLPLFASGRLFLDFAAYPDGPNGGELLRLLYAVVGQPLSEQAARFATDQDEAAKQARPQIQAAIQNKDSARLQQLFEDGGLPWQTSAVLGCLAAEGLTKLGQNDAAIQVLQAVRERFPNAIRPKQLEALALARRGQDGDLKAAQQILGELYAQGERDPETVGIYARTWMDRYEKSRDVGDLKQSRDYYAAAFAVARDDYYTGINAATKSVFLGTSADLEAAAAYATAVQKIVGTEPRPGNYWMTATVAEVFLIQRTYQKAAQLYEAAVATARSEVGSHATTWKQANRLMDKLQPSDAERALVRGAFAHLADAGRG